MNTTEPVQQPIARSKEHPHTNNHHGENEPDPQRKSWLIGLGVGLVFVAVSITAVAGIPARHAGMASGFLMTGHEIGAALGVAVLAAVATAGR